MIQLPSLSTIERPSLKDTAVQQIRVAISRGELKPGERITELGLAKSLGVGQATIREALLDLEHQGFIQRRGPRKTYVTALTRRDVVEIYQVRQQLEDLVLELLAGAKVREIPACEQACQRMKTAAVANDIPQFIDADLQFHLALWQATGNRLLAEILEKVANRLFAYDVSQPASFTPPKLKRIAREHYDLLRLLSEGEYKAARNQMQKSMREALDEDYQIPRE
jgi:DNA-binding GntR family transcriptional regulator